MDLSSEDAPDAKTFLKFRRLLESQRLKEVIFAEADRYLEEMKQRMKENTSVNATIIVAPSSTKNPAGAETQRCTRRAGQPMVLWDEAAYRNKCTKRIGAPGVGDSGTCQRCE